MPEVTEEVNVKVTIDAADMISNKYGLVIRVKNFKRTALRLRVSALFLDVARWLWPCELFLIETAAVNPECGYACGDVEPYGFVPEAGCPVHDADADKLEIIDFTDRDCYPNDCDNSCVILQCIAHPLHSNYVAEFDAGAEPCNDYDGFVERATKANADRDDPSGDGFSDEFDYYRREPGQTDD